MSVESPALTRERVRVFMTGSCDGLHDLREALERHLEVELVGWAEHVSEGSSVLTGGHLGVVLHGTRGDFPGDELAKIREHTRAPVILLASGEASGVLEQALDADVADVLLLPQMTENVVFAIRKAARSGGKSQPGGGRRGRIVTVFSPKGGTGKTCIATNSAAAVAKYEGKKCLLLDLDLQFGDAAIMLGIEPEKTIYDLVVAPGELDTEKLAGYVTRHASGLDILPAPLRPEDAELVTEAKLAQLLEVAQESYDVIVVDTSPFFHGPMLATLDRTDELLLLCGLDVPDDQEREAHAADARAALVPPGPDPARAEPGQLEGRDEAGRGREGARREGALLDSERPRGAVAVNRGNPAVLADGKGDFARAVRTMATQLIPVEADKAAKKRWFGR